MIPALCRALAAKEGFHGNFRLTSWNIEHADKLVTALASADGTTRARADQRADAIAEEIAAINPDILLVVEGPKGEARAGEFLQRVAPGYRLVRRGGEPRDYGTQGTQWMWFALRDGLSVAAQLVHLDRWRALTEASSEGAHRGGRWEVSYPILDPGAQTLRFSVPESHGHYRHPQVLQLTIGSALVEIIGCHLKSKINSIPVPPGAEAPDFFDRNPALVADVMMSRTKLTTECVDVRHYIDGRFLSEPDAAIIVAGDLNDGPGKERVERRFLYHDLVDNLQGDIFFARRFLNHALFDFDEAARWSYDLGRDRLDPGRSPRILLDHILFAQALTGPDRPGAAAYRARAGGGKVEHDIHYRVTSARPKHAAPSDHRPVTMVLDRRPCPSPDARAASRRACRAARIFQPCNTD